MANFIEDYLHNPALAISSAQTVLESTDRFDAIDEDDIYTQISSGEFRLYEEIIFSNSAGESPHAENFSRVA
jgi:hypothetical protein